MNNVFNNVSIFFKKIKNGTYKRSYKQICKHNIYVLLTKVYVIFDI